MQIKDIFAKDINRSINGVIKVAQDDDESVRQELSEYVVTRELSRHFSAFFETYTAALDVPTDKIGVWISGFFGSGKSHFLKMLSYLLSNREAAGVRAIDYFDGKVEDPMVYSKMKRACSVPTEAILFNIDDKAANWKEGATAKTALLRAFARVFYEHRGFYGSNLKLGRLEEHIEEQGKLEEFRRKFFELSGLSWEECREGVEFHEDEIVEVLHDVLGWSEAQARHQFDRVEDEAIAPEDLVNQIAAYVERRTKEEGGQFRLLFMVDEVGQFIGSDVNLMLNLQTLVEGLGTRCRGQVWVMVTSQEAIDEVTKVAGNDFSKIQGRFNTRLSLSSSSVDEVIKRRVLEKNDEARSLLESTYATQAPVLKNLFTFENARGDWIGYKNEVDFQETYPFVDYQFNLVRDILREIRVHGNSGKHLSGGERSMLSGFQESAQAVKNSDTRALVPLWRFYDTLAAFLEHDIRQVIDRCQVAAENAAGIQPQDVAVLKTLYLIRYISDIVPTVGNISILMVDSMDVDKVALREDVTASLTRLVRQNYVNRSGDAYHFLTNVEQDVAREIKGTDIDTGAIAEGVAKVIFDDLFTMRKLRIGVNDFPIDAYVDDALHGVSQGGMKLNIITQTGQLAGADEATLQMQSGSQALVVLAGNGEYYEALSNAAKIDKYVKTKNIQQLDPRMRTIVMDKQKEAAASRKEARALIEQAIVEARCYIHGRSEDVRANSAEKKLEEVLRRLAQVVFTSAGYIDAPVNDQGDIVRILTGTDQRGLEGAGGANERAAQDMERFLLMQKSSMQQTSMGDLRRHYRTRPFGWREIDVAAVVARLIADQKVEVSRAGAIVESRDSKLAGYLTNAAEADKIKISLRERVDELLVSRVRKILHDLPGMNASLSSEDEIFDAVKGWIAETKEHCNALLTSQYTRGKKYPGRDVVEQGRTLLGELTNESRNAKTLFEAIHHKGDDLLDFVEDYENVCGFFETQQHLFDDALAVLDLMTEDADFMAQDAAVSNALAALNDIVNASAPYGRISEINSCVGTVQSAHNKAVVDKRRTLIDRLSSVEEQVCAYAEDKEHASQVVSQLPAEVTNLRESINAANKLINLAAIEGIIDKFADEQIYMIDEAEDSHRAKEEQERAVATKAGEGGSAPVTIVRSTVSQPSPAIQPKPEARTIRRAELCMGKRLSTPEEVDDYVEGIRKRLLDAIEQSGSVRIVG